jgi:hypothetical protein
MPPKFSANPLLCTLHSGDAAYVLEQIPYFVRYIAGMPPMFLSKSLTLHVTWRGLDSVGPADTSFCLLDSGKAAQCPQSILSMVLLDRSAASAREI